MAAIAIADGALSEGGYSGSSEDDEEGGSDLEFRERCTQQQLVLR